MLSEKKTVMPPASQVASTKRAGQPLEDVHVFSNKKRLQAAKEAQNPSQDKQVLKFSKYSECFELIYHFSGMDLTGLKC